MECGWNRGWVKDCFGGSILSQVGGKVISCSGTSLATWDAALQYVSSCLALLASVSVSVSLCLSLSLDLSLLTSLDLSLHLTLSHTHSPHCSLPAVLRYTKLMNDELLSNSCERNGVDQGMHNVWVHTERVKPMHIWWNEDGPIATVQSMKELHRDHFGRLTNTKGGTRTPPSCRRVMALTWLCLVCVYVTGEVYAVVHQYDRSKVLEAQYNSEYTYLQQRDMSIRK